MEQRIAFTSVAPGAYEAMSGLERYVRSCGLEKPLLELVKIRASQINGCAFCIDMHTKDARAAGEREDRIYLLNAWAEAHCYTPRERAALSWTEAVTLVHRDRVPDAVYEHAREHFTEKELVDLTTAIVVINGWNRLEIAFRGQSGIYQPDQKRPGTS